jgi:phosphohistidine phosphatase SixA
VTARIDSGKGEAMKLTRFKLSLILFSIALIAVASTSRAGGTNEVLLGAMSPFEDMIEYALAGQDSGVSEALAAADQNSKSVMETLHAPAAQELTALMDALRDAAKSRDSLKTATYAVDIFRLLTDNLQADSLDVPKEVSLLDYAGFRLRVLAASKNPDWRDVRTTIGEAAGWWKAVRPRVSMRGLIDTFDTLVGGLEDSERTRNVEMLGFAAQMTLDLVDLLESDLKAKP